jgi:hypothetical protein
MGIQTRVLEVCSKAPQPCILPRALVVRNILKANTIHSSYVIVIILASVPKVYHLVHVNIFERVWCPVALCWLYCTREGLGGGGDQFPDKSVCSVTWHHLAHFLSPHPSFRQFVHPSSTRLLPSICSLLELLPIARWRLLAGLGWSGLDGRESLLRHIHAHKVTTLLYPSGGKCPQRRWALNNSC